MRTSVALQDFLKNHKKQSYRDLCPTNIIFGQPNELSDTESEMDNNSDSGYNSEISTNEEGEV